MEPDLWDRLFKINLPVGDSGISLNAFASSLGLYSTGDYTQQQIAQNLVDAQGNLLPPEQLAQATLLTDLLDATPGTGITQAFNKSQMVAKITRALILAEEGQITKAQGVALLGL